MKLSTYMIYNIGFQLCDEILNKDIWGVIYVFMKNFDKY